MILGDGRITWVRWYKALDTALPLPFPTAFGSAVWITDYDDDSPPVGMQGPTPPGRPKVPSIYEWRPCSYPAPPGTHWHGDPQWFLTGLPPDQLAQPPYLDRCGTPLIQPSGGACSCGTAVITSVSGTGAESLGDAVADGISTARTSTMFVLPKTTPATLTSDQNDYPLTDFTCFRLASTLPVTLTGLAGGIDGRMIIMENIGGFPILISDQSGSSSAVNRVISQDGGGVPIYPGSSSWLQYDGTSERWRETATQSYLRSQGDLLTSDGTSPHVLTAGADADVLTRDSSQLTGLKWAPAPGGGGPGGRDINWWRATQSTILGPHYYRSTFAPPGILGFNSAPNANVYLTPFISPPGGHLDRAGLKCVTRGSILDLFVLGIYDSSWPINGAPRNLLWSSPPLGYTAGQMCEDNPDLDLDPNVLYYLATTGTNTHGSLVLGYVTTVQPWWPLFGFSGSVPEVESTPHLFLPRTYDGTLPNPWPGGEAYAFSGESLVPAIYVRYLST